MISYDSLVKPYSSFEGCGDFSVVIERSDSHLIVVGDVGGHGSYKIGQVAHFIEQLVNDNSAADIDYIFKSIANSQLSEKFGVMLFVGRIDKRLPLLNYICVGDLKIKVFRQNNWITLHSQNGMVGKHLPQKINRFASKLHDADLLSITTDGVNRNILEVVNKQSLASKLTDLNKRIMQQAGSKSDDSLSLLIRFKQSNSNLPIPNQLATPHSTELVNYRSADLAEVSIKPVRLNPLNIEPRNIEKLKAQHLFCILDNDTLAKDKIHSLLSFLDFPRELDLKLQTLILELIYHTQTGVKIYYHNKRLQIEFASDDALFESCRIILGEKHLFKNQLDGSYIISFLTTKQIDAKDEKFAQLKERIQIGLPPSAYKQYQKDKQRDETLAQQAKLASMGEMIGSIAHQWRQPLNELAIRIQTLKYQIKQAEDVDKLLATFTSDNLATIKFMSKTIDDFRNFFKVDKEKQFFSLMTAIEQVKLMLVAQFEKDNIRLDIQGEDVSINSYQSEIQQVLLNLISNAKDALKHSDNPNKHIKVVIKDNKVLIQDNGGGIPQDIEAQIFEPYYTTKSHGEGTGIGLYMSKLIVENHLCGQLTFQNIHAGENQQGAQFTIHFPDDAPADHNNPQTQI